MSNEIDRILKEMNDKLNVLISLTFGEKPTTIREKVEFLSRFDISNKDISRIISISESHATKEKSLAKKEKDRAEQSD